MPRTVRPSALVVDDDAVSRVLLQRLLERRFHVSAVNDGRAAVAAHETALAWGAPFELVCLDIMLPDWDGHRALRELRRLERACLKAPAVGAKVVMVSAMRDSSHVLQAFRDSCDGYLVKPLDAAKLEKTLHQLGFAAPVPRQIG
jgi:two-component system chemotaxis response regulator CheY